MKQREGEGGGEHKESKNEKEGQVDIAVAIYYLNVFPSVDLCTGNP